MKKYKAAVIGLGFIGPQHIDALHRTALAMPEVICDVNEAAVAEACERYGVHRGCTDWRQVVADPTIDVIHNCTPHALHDEINRAAMMAGKHVYSEKPLSMTAAGAREMVALAKEKGVAAGLNHQYRMNAAVQDMRLRYEQGQVGRALFLGGCYMQESAVLATDWHPKMANTGIARTINDIGIHWVDTAMAVMGQPVTEVLCETFIHHPIRTDAEGGIHPMDTEDTALILLRFADGTPGQITVTKAAMGHMNDLQLQLFGDGCSLEWRQEEPDRLRMGLKNQGYTTLYMNPKTCQEALRPYITTPMGHVMGWPDALRNALNAFYGSIEDGSYRTGKVPYATFADGFAGMAFVEACVKSAKERCWVAVEQL